jgi:hypothetical protein
MPHLLYLVKLCLIALQRYSRHLQTRADEDVQALRVVRADAVAMDHNTKISMGYRLYHHFNGFMALQNGHKALHNAHGSGKGL